MKILIEEISVWCSAILKVLPGRVGRLLRNFSYRSFFKKVGSHLSICEGVEIAGFANISLGSHSYLVDGAVLRACDNARINIGDYFAMNGNARVVADNGGVIRIGNHVMIGPNVVVRASNHCHDRVDIPIWEQGQTGGEIVIGDDVWIAANAVILPDVIIGSHVIVAAGAVVTKAVPDYAVVAGVPAKVIARRTSSDVCVCGAA